MSKPDALATITQNIADRVANLSPEQLATFQMLEAERAAEKGESVADRLAFIDLLKTIGNGNAVESGTPAADKTVENREQEKQITERLAANGRTPQKIEQDLAVLKWAGTLMAGGGITQAQDNTVTPVNIAKPKTPDLPDH